MAPSEGPPSTPPHQKERCLAPLTQQRICEMQARSELPNTHHNTTEVPGTGAGILSGQAGTSHARAQPSPTRPAGEQV